VYAWHMTQYQTNRSGSRGLSRIAFSTGAIVSAARPIAIRARPRETYAAAWLGSRATALSYVASAASNRPDGRGRAYLRSHAVAQSVPTIREFASSSPPCASGTDGRTTDPRRRPRTAPQSRRAPGPPRRGDARNTSRNVLGVTIRMPPCSWTSSRSRSPLTR
jgi:hypothetical protein